MTVKGKKVYVKGRVYRHKSHKKALKQDAAIWLSKHKKKKRRKK